ncbi:putative coiled-coil domain-containing protein 13 isoform X1 [Diplonema papillatum]|nr:putative coiled-coil domain-containing protein 13 isoform X1 [Diplonema papillatum]
MSEEDGEGDAPLPMVDVTELTALIARQKDEIERLQTALTSTGDGTMEQKYLDALRKVKALNVKYESERSKADKLVNQLVETENRYRENEKILSAAQSHAGSALLGGNRGQLLADENGNSAEADAAKARELREKVEKLQKANADLKRQAASFKQEQARLRDVLKREVGDQDYEKVIVPLLQPASGPTGQAATPPTPGAWRGRAQTISILKSKVKELQRQLAEATNSADPEGPVCPSDSASQAPSAHPRSLAGYNGAPANADFDEVNRRALSEVTSARHKVAQQFQDENKGLQQQVSESKTRVSAMQARVLTLENEVATLKIHLARVIQKTENDDQLLCVYKAELEAKRGEVRQMAAAGRTANDPKTRPSPTHSNHTAERDQASDRDQKISALESEVHGLRAQLAAKLADDAQTLLRAQEEWLSRNAQDGGDLLPSESSAPSVKFALAQLEVYKEYAGVVRKQLAEAMTRLDMAEEALHTQKAAFLRTEDRSALQSVLPDVGKVDYAALPEPVVRHLLLLKGEVTSLKERVSLMKANHEAEQSVWKDMTQRQQEVVDKVCPALSERDPGDQTPRADRSDATSNSPTSAGDQQHLRAEHEELKEQYRVLKMAYNNQALALQQRQQ